MNRGGPAHFHPALVPGGVHSGMWVETDGTSLSGVSCRPAPAPFCLWFFPCLLACAFPPRPLGLPFLVAGPCLCVLSSCFLSLPSCWSCSSSCLRGPLRPPFVCLHCFQPGGRQLLPVHQVPPSWCRGWAFHLRYFFKDHLVAEVLPGLHPMLGVLGWPPGWGA